MRIVGQCAYLYNATKSKGTSDFTDPDDYERMLAKLLRRLRIT